MIHLERIDAEGAKGVCLLRVSGEMTLMHSAEIMETFRNAVDSCVDISVNLDGVTELDLTGMQLLCSAHSTACSRDRKFLLVPSTSGLLAKTLVEGGFSRHIGCARHVHSGCFWQQKGAK